MTSEDNPVTLSQLVGEVLQKGHLKLATAESCTGGWVSKTITDTAGSSAWFVCGLATYSDKVKSKLLGVSDITLERYGAVSEETAFEMAEGALYRTEADVALAVTGIAGPDGGSADKPVGTVCFAWVRRNQRVEAVTQHFAGDRESVRWQSVIFALEGLLRYLSPRTEAALEEVAAPTYVEPVLVTASAVPVQRKTPFELIEEGKIQLAGLLDNLRIDRNTVVSDAADTDGAIAPSALVAEYRGAVAALSPLKRQSFSQQVYAIGEYVQQACEMDQSAMIGCAHLDSAGAYTVLHPLHQAIFLELIAKSVGVPAAERLSIIAATLTSNIAMLNLQETLQHQAGPLTPLQKRLLLLHPMLANEMLLELGVDDPVWLEAVSAHHERADGKGYPSGTGGDQISIGARLIALVDVYDAMIKPREHREPNQRAALRQLFLMRGQAIDDKLASVAIKEIGVYPPGAFVKLENGEVAVVVKRLTSSVRPIVRSIISAEGERIQRPQLRNTDEPMFAILDVVPRDRSVALDLPGIWDYRK